MERVRRAYETRMGQFRKLTFVVLFLSLTVLSSCKDLVPRDASSLLIPRLQRSEIVGLAAGFGTTFAAMPDLLAMLRRRSSTGMNPRMAAITGFAQIAWIYYGVLIASRPVVVWNVIAVFINFFSVTAYFHFVRREKANRRR
jgi:MtN3 and saliva related transmembrane protein